ncbi:MAG: hypothetical protein CM15mP120_24350 [Pseudomonadota bacterium]|nr:MAG: hypothetical protein CM15mP120_24350 [Pseudomonadota bacterium]
MAVLLDVLTGDYLAELTIRFFITNNKPAGRCGLCDIFKKKLKELR